LKSRLSIQIKESDNYDIALIDNSINLAKEKGNLSKVEDIYLIESNEGNI